MSVRNSFLFGIVVLICIGAGKNYAQDNPSYDFLKVDPSARASALAGAFETITDDPNVIFYNPAGLSTMTMKKCPPVSVNICWI